MELGLPVIFHECNWSISSSYYPQKRFSCTPPRGLGQGLIMSDPWPRLRDPSSIFLSESHQDFTNISTWFLCPMPRCSANTIVASWLVVTGTWLLFFHSSWECHHPNWRTPSFFRGIEINHQPVVKCSSDYGHNWLLWMLSPVLCIARYFHNGNNHHYNHKYVHVNNH